MTTNPQPRRVSLRELFPEENPCTAILEAAARFYMDDMKLKNVPLEEDETPGERAAKIPRLGDVAGCKKRGR